MFKILKKTKNKIFSVVLLATLLFSVNIKSQETINHKKIIKEIPEYLFIDYWKEKWYKLLQKHTIIEINKIRKAYHLSQLLTDSFLNKKAQEYAEYMAKNEHFSHTTIDWKSLADFVNVNTRKKFYFPVSEVLWSGLMNIEMFIDGLMHSEWHKNTIIEKNYDYGKDVFDRIGVWYKDWYWIILFWWKQKPINLN